MTRLGAVLLLLPLVACGGQGSDGEVTLRVYAAASLTDTFTTLADQFEADHPGTRVVLNLGPSSGLAEQIGNGAPADVFAAASPTNMDTVAQHVGADDPQVFARNRLAIAVPRDDPGDVDSLSDLARTGVKVAVCQEQVPCGRVAAEVLAGAGLTVRPATEESDVRSVLTKVRLGEVDAGLVYATDVRTATDEVRSIDVPAGLDATTDYPIAALTGSENAGTARQFVEHVLSDEGARVLRAAGFELP